MLDNITCEKLIHFLAGTQEIPGIDYPTLDRTDYNLINSFSRQLARKIGFTDRQYELAKTKIDYYAEQLPGIDLEAAKTALEIPLREIDRAKWIDIQKDEATGQYTNVLIRFTFSKRLINNIEKLKQDIGNNDWSYDKDNKTHIVKYSERNLYDVVKAFEDKNFELTADVQEMYKVLNCYEPDDYVPGVYNYTVKNMSPTGIEYITQELGEPTEDNLVLYRDRSLRYGLEYFDDDLSKCLSQSKKLVSSIANRKSKSVIVNRETANIEDVVLALEELKRLPVLIVLPSAEAHDVLVTVHDRIKNIISSDDICTMFRKENNTPDGAYLNEYIRKEKINNKLANNTKIVYTLDNKVPKPLIKSEFNPMAVLVHSIGSSPYSVRKMLGCYEDKDLIIHYSSKDSRSSAYFYDRSIETING